MRFGRWRPVALGALVGVVGGFLLFLWPGPAASVAGGSPPLPHLYRAPSYRLVDQLGRAVSSDSFQGKVRIVVLLDPYCTALCPLTASKVLNLERTLEQRGLARAVQVVAFDINRDTGPAEMRAFLAQESIDPNEGWLDYLSGPPAAVREAVAGGYHIDYQEPAQGAAPPAPQTAAAGAQPSAYKARLRNPVAERAGATFEVAHQDPLLIVDQRGWVRALYGSASTTPTPTVVADVASLIRGAR